MKVQPPDWYVEDPPVRGPRTQMKATPQQGTANRKSGFLDANFTEAKRRSADSRTYSLCVFSEPHSPNHRTVPEPLPGSQMVAPM